MNQTHDIRLQNQTQKLTKPNLYPEAISIAFEMATYAFVAGYLYSCSKWKCTKALYRCMLTAMVGGRIVRIIAQFLLLGINGKSFALASSYFHTKKQKNTKKHNVGGKHNDLQKFSTNQIIGIGSRNDASACS